MKHKEELGAALEAAEAVLSDLDVTTCLLVVEIGDHGLQIALSDQTDALTVRAALRGAADALEGRHRPLMAELHALLKARGWSTGEGGWTHPKLEGTPMATQRLSIVDALASQTYLELTPPEVHEASVDG